jgi:hypothetical protein
MITQEQWQAAKEEFKERAFEQFKIGFPYYYSFNNNDDVEDKMSHDYDVELKALSQELK